MSDSVEPKKQEEQVCSFFKKPSKSKNIRKRPDPSPLPSSSEGSGDEGSSVVYKKKKIAGADNKLHFASGSSKPQHDSETGHAFQFESVKEIQVHNDSKATATLETETVSREKAGGSHGPLKPSSNIRRSVIIDCQSNYCKDYKETGYCGYGDSCKFLHIRENYKSGWQMEKEWDEAEKARKMNSAMGIEKSEVDSDDDGLPFACSKCNGPFADPVVTKCGHYFCAHCALKHHERNKKCAVCNQPTDGTFNAPSSEIRKRMADRNKQGRRNPVGAIDEV